MFFRLYIVFQGKICFSEALLMAIFYLLSLMDEGGAKSASSFIIELIWCMWLIGS